MSTATQHTLTRQLIPGERYRLLGHTFRRVSDPPPVLQCQRHVENAQSYGRPSRLHIFEISTGHISEGEFTLQPGDTVALDIHLCTFAHTQH